MIQGVEIKPIKKWTDDRGYLSEIYRTDETDFRPAMSYLSETKPGVVRGPHEHREQSDYFVFIIGEFKLYLWDNREGAPNYRQLEVHDVGGDNPCSVIIPPGVVHGYKCVSKESGFTVNLPDQLFMGEGKKSEVDEIRWESMEDSPFTID